MKKTYGQRLAAAIEAAGMQQQEFAAAAGISQSYTSNFIRGRANPEEAIEAAAETIRSHAEALNIDPSELSDLINWDAV